MNEILEILEAVAAAFLLGLIAAAAFSPKLLVGGNLFINLTVQYTFLYADLVTA